MQGYGNQICVWRRSVWHQCGEIGKEATAIVHARGDGGLGWKGVCRGGDAAME